MSWWSTIVGFFTGGASIAGAVEGATKVIQQAEQMVQQSNERTAGINQERATEDAIAAKVNANVAKAAVGSTDAAALDELRGGSA